MTKKLSMRTVPIDTLTDMKKLIAGLLAVLLGFICVCGVSLTPDSEPAEPARETAAKDPVEAVEAPAAVPEVRNEEAVPEAAEILDAEEPESPEVTEVAEALETEEPEPAEVAEAQEAEEPEPVEIVEVPEAEEPELPEAEQVELVIKVGRGDYSYTFSDDYLNTYQHIYEGTDVTLRSADGTEFSQLYFVWYYRIGDYAAELVYPDGETVSIPGNMLHQVIHLDRPASELTLRLREGAGRATLSGLTGYTVGKLPSDVQDWQLLGDGEADLMLFPTHADDEYVFFGGILPIYAGELGYKVQVCWTCCHDNSYGRNHELLNALWHSGCVYYPQINYEAIDYYCGDYSAALYTYSYEEFEAYEVEMIRKYKPYVVVTHDESGEYGHGAHILTSYTVEDACADAAYTNNFPESEEKYGVWQVQKLYVHLNYKNKLTLDYDTPLEHFDGKTAYEVAMECFALHASQYYSGFTVYMGNSEYDSRVFGLYRTSVGRDTEHNDLFENVNFCHG